MAINWFEDQGEHSAILSTFIKLPFVIKIFVCRFLRGCFTQVLLYYIQVYLCQGPIEAWSVFVHKS